MMSCHGGVELSSTGETARTKVLWMRLERPSLLRLYSPVKNANVNYDLKSHVWKWNLYGPIHKWKVLAVQKGKRFKGSWKRWGTDGGDSKTKKRQKERGISINLFIYIFCLFLSIFCLFLSLSIYFLSLFVSACLFSVFSFLLSALLGLDILSDDDREEPRTSIPIPS